MTKRGRLAGRLLCGRRRIGRSQGDRSRVRVPPSAPFMTKRGRPAGRLLCGRQRIGRSQGDRSRVRVPPSAPFMTKRGRLGAASLWVPAERAVAGRQVEGSSPSQRAIYDEEGPPAGRLLCGRRRIGRSQGDRSRVRVPPSAPRLTKRSRPLRRLLCGCWRIERSRGDRSGVRVPPSAPLMTKRGRLAGRLLCGRRRIGRSQGDRSRVRVPPSAPFMTKRGRLTGRRSIRKAGACSGLANDDDFAGDDGRDGLEEDVLGVAGGGRFELWTFAADHAPGKDVEAVEPGFGDAVVGGWRG